MEKSVPPPVRHKLGRRTRAFWRGAFVCLLGLGAAGCGSGVLPAQNQRAATDFVSYDQVVNAYEQIVPGRTSTQDLARIGFDARTGNVDVLSYLGIQERFMPRDSFKFDQLNPAVKACILSETGCTGFAFHPAHSATRRIGNAALDILGFQRVTRSEHWSAEIVLLMQNGIVTYKVFSGSPRTENVEDRVQPLGPLQDLGGALARGVGAAGVY